MTRLHCLFACAALSLMACSPNGGDDSADADGDGDADGDAEGDVDGAVEDGGGGDDAGPQCVNLQCQQQSCPGGTTRISGTIFAPTLEDPDPVPGVYVYVPNSAVAAFGPTVECTTCDTFLSGSPLVQTVTATDGTFALDNVPAGENIPLVLQLGRWRRQITLPSVEACGETVLPAELARLPRNQGEGDIPKMALVTGSHDPLECMLAKMVDVAELTAPDGGGRIHLYRQTGNDMATPVPARSQLLASLDTLLQYDAILLPCPSHEQYAQEEAERLQQYADQGGRIFNTHGGGFWMFEPVDLYAGMVAFNNQPDPAVRIASVDTTFDKGVVFADWLSLIGATEEYGLVHLESPQWFVDSVQAPAQRWVYTLDPATVQHFTFNTPLDVADDARCGRVLFSNFHVASGLSESIFPEACVPGPLTPDEKIIEFMLFDVTACVRPDIF